MLAPTPSPPPGSGTNLPTTTLLLATLAALGATAISLGTIALQLKNYRRPSLQRYVVRILVMVPIYAVSSLISLYSLNAAIFVDSIRDVYEAFVIYCFFTLLIEYLGGERETITLLHGRPPIHHPWPVSNFLPPMDVSDPFTFLAIKRGILQYVQVKPILAVVTVVLKARGSYKDGSLESGSGYTYVTIAYNISVALSLYCLAMFWLATNDDLKPFRPMPKFVCVKSIIFATFWQGYLVSILVAIGLISSSRYPTEMLSLAIQDTLICLETPAFAFMHLYAFSYTDYIDDRIYSGRLPFFYALRDAFGYKDVFSDSLTTVKGTGFSYRTFEPATGIAHQGLSHDPRIRAGLRYSAGGKAKYWLTDPSGRGRAGPSRGARRDGYLPVGEGVREGGDGRGGGERGDESEDESVAFGDPDDGMEALYRNSRKLEYGDFNYPIVDASKEDARRRMREEEDLRAHRDPHSHSSNADPGGKGKGRPNAAPPSHRFSYGRLAEPSIHERSPPGSPGGGDTARRSGSVHSGATAGDERLDVVMDDTTVEEEVERDRRRVEAGGDGGELPGVGRVLESSVDAGHVQVGRILGQPEEQSPWS